MAYQRVTLGALEDRLAERLGGEETFWSEPERRGALNEALALWQLLTGEFVATVTQSLVPGTQYVTYTSATDPAATFLRVRCDPCGVQVAVTATTSGGDDTFLLTPTVSYAATPYSYLWDFGDSSTSTSTTPPVHTYSTSGTYTVSVTVTDTYGCTDTATVGVVATVVAVPGTLMGFVNLGGSAPYNGHLVRIDAVTTQTTLSGDTIIGDPTTNYVITDIPPGDWDVYATSSLDTSTFIAGPFTVTITANEITYRNITGGG